MNNKKIRKTNFKITIIGLGYVGLPLLKLVHSKGYNVTGLDVDQQKIKNLKQEFNVTINASNALSSANCYIICVPTPVDENHKPDLSFVISVSKNIARHLSKDRLVIIESTIAPGTTENVVIPILEKSKLKAGTDFFVAHCPERIDPGNKKWNVKNIPRVLGGFDEKSTQLAFEFYDSILNADITMLSSLKSAEAVKIIENTFRDINIAFVNELARSFEKIGIDVLEVIKGASTKPFGFLPHYPGCGVGGHCIAIDPYYLIYEAEKKGFSHKFLKLAREINNDMPKYTVQRVIQGLNEIEMPVKKSKITILGLSYKGGVSDIRESPSFPIINQLTTMGANLTIFDPYNLDKSDVQKLDDAISKSDCIVLITDHPEFKKINAEILKKNKVKVVIDGRNFLDKEQIIEKNIIYKGIGR